MELFVLGGDLQENVFEVQKTFKVESKLNAELLIIYSHSISQL